MFSDTKNFQLQQEYEAFRIQWNNADEFITQQTSGSTGKPKQIQITKSMMKASALMTGDFFELKSGQSALLCISPAYIGGKMMIVRSELFDLELIITNVSRRPLEHLTQNIDFAAMVPIQVSETLNYHPEKLDLIETLIIGGAPVSHSLEAALQSSKCQAYSTYGMTETVSHIALKKLDNSNAPFVGMGKTSFSVSADCLVINSPELAIINLKTNDVVELQSVNSFHWIGRSDFTINSGGIKLQPEKIEAKLAQILAKELFIISSIADETLGQKVILIASKELKNKIDFEEFNSLLNRYERPKDIYYVNKIKRTANGKVDRLATTKLIHAH